MWRRLQSENTAGFKMTAMVHITHASLLRATFIPFRSRREVQPYPQQGAHPDSPAEAGVLGWRERAGSGGGQAAGTGGVGEKCESLCPRLYLVHPLHGLSVPTSEKMCCEATWRWAINRFWVSIWHRNNLTKSNMPKLCSILFKELFVQLTTHYSWDVINPMV